MFEDISIVFCTCDKYSDLWGGFFQLFKKYWPEFRGEIILNTDSLRYEYPGLNIINLPHSENESSAWSNMLHKALKACKNEKTLMILEDFYFIDRVDNERMAKAVNLMNKDDTIKSITFFNEPGGYKPINLLDGFMVRKQFSTYKMTAHLTLYDKAFLMSILRDGENAWQFEVNGTIRAWFRSGVFLCSQKGVPPIIPYDGDFVRHGKFVKERREYYENNEGLTFSKDRQDLNSLDEEHGSGSMPKKIKYLIQGLTSFFSQHIK